MSQNTVEQQLATLIEQLGSVATAIQALRDAAVETGALAPDSEEAALERAYRRGGIRSPRALREAADRAYETYAVLRDGGARIQDVRSAFGHYAEEERAAGYGAPPEEVKAALRAEAIKIGYGGFYWLS